jgi:DNA polymerase elongation subunit (family B)
MAYLDAFFRRGGDQEVIKVVERVNGKRVYKEYAPDYHFFINDPKGIYKSIYGDTVKKIIPRTFGEKQKIIKSISHNVKKWETDVDTIFRCLEQNYQHIDAPSLNIAFFDIETSFDKESGWSDASEADNYITSISIHLQWIDEIICLAIPPETLTWDEAQEIADQVGNVVLFKSEGEMLQSFMDVIEDADILSGWNSEAYDIPYVVNRIKKVLGRHEARKLCLWEQEPKAREYERGGKVQQTYDLIGRVHVDYLQLYKKYNYEERHSYALNAIAQIELGETKVQYDGTLDELYNDDFKKFLEYNIQDTRLLDRLDKELQFVDLANSIAHANCVLIQTTMGAVAVTDQAVMVEAHNNHKVVPDKKHSGKDETATRAAGGWVATPKKGFHRWIASTDMKSLYPSVIRTLNMSPETIVGQIRLTRTSEEIAAWEAKGSKYTFATWWNDRFNVVEMEDFYNQDIGTKLILDMEDGSEFEVTGKELYDLIFESGQPWCISANGTIFKTDIDGIIPTLLTRWYKERKTLQGIMTNYQDIEDNTKIEGIEVPAELFTNDNISDVETKADPYSESEAYKPKKLKEIIVEGHKKRVVQYMNQHNLMVKEGKAIHRDQKDLKGIIGFWDKRQLVKKINLNSAYGALLNAGSRFFDQRLGQSTTLTGRTITKHMAAKTNEMMTGEYDHYGKAIVYGDTDSCYFSAYPILKNEIDAGEVEWTKDSIIDTYNSLAKAVSATFPDFLLKKLNVPIKRSTGVIASSRETVSQSGIWMVKKRYACLMYDKDGIRLDVGGKPGKVKAMGLDLKRADTPKFVQEFLSEILMDTLTDKGENAVIEKIRIFKEQFENMKPWKQGTPKAVNKLSHYRDKLEDAGFKKLKGIEVGNLHVPGHVTASLAWNTLKEINQDQHAMRIIDGQKIIVCKLKETSENRLSSIAYPVDIAHLPDWFLNLPFDTDGMQAGIVDKKIENLLSTLHWDLSRTNKEHAHLETLFDFSGM